MATVSPNKARQSEKLLLTHFEKRRKIHTRKFPLRLTLCFFYGLLIDIKILNS